MLEKIVQGKEDSNFILIKDNIHCDGNPLLNAFIVESCKRFEKVLLIQYDSPKSSSNHPKLKELEKNGNVECLDGFTDPLDWDGRHYEGNLIGYDNLDKVLQSVDHPLVIFNSLTPLLINQSVNEVYRNLNNLRTKKDCKIIALLHSDIHDSIDVKIIDKLADAKLEIDKCRDDVTLSVCSTFLRKPSGKLSINVEYFKLDSNLKLILQEPYDYLKRVDSANKKPIDPASNLTFNLTLKDDEKVARQELVLPYTQISNSETGGGKIIYNPDISDDIDEDDPDDDLDI